MPRIPTDNPQLELIDLAVEHVAEFHRLVIQNRDHLTVFGDYEELVQSSQRQIRDELSCATPGTVFGVWFIGKLIGRADLVPRSSDIYVLGYWIDRDHTGHGYMTIACRALLHYARNELGANAIYAGVTNGNNASKAVLERLGFDIVERRSAYVLYCLKFA